MLVALYEWDSLGISVCTIGEINCGRTYGGIQKNKECEFKTGKKVSQTSERLIRLVAKGE